MQQTGKKGKTGVLKRMGNGGMLEGRWRDDDGFASEPSIIAKANNIQREK